LDVLVALNAKLVRADKAWAQWLVAAVADFVARHEGCGHPIEEAASQWVEQLLAASATNLGRKITRQIRRELARLRAGQSTMAHELHLAVGSEVQQSSQVGTSESDLDDCNIGTTTDGALDRTRPASSRADPARSVNQRKKIKPRPRCSVSPTKVRAGRNPGVLPHAYLRSFLHHQQTDCSRLGTSSMGLFLCRARGRELLLQV
jgi:hypothetical protein